MASAHHIREFPATYRKYGFESLPKFAPPGYTVIPVDLNKGVVGAVAMVFLCYTKGGAGADTDTDTGAGEQQRPISDIVVDWQAPHTDPVGAKVDAAM
jgi:hypothetical protein